MDPIAVVGFSFRLPQGIEDTSSLWDTLENGRNVMTPWPEERINIDSFYSADPSQKNRLHSAGGHFIEGKLGEFDASFFRINSREAAAMDPQQQVLLETSYRALENAGIPLNKVAGTNAGVFTGSMSDDYSRLWAKDPDDVAVHAATGQTMAMLANRLSWFFDMRGPSVQVNTACSSSMIAVDLACQSLRTGQSSLTLVTGSSIMLGPEMSLYLTNMNVLSPDSLCYSFDHRANGYSRGDGVIVFVLKRLTDAVRDGDMVRAVIRATGSNQDGATPGITQPSIASQEDLIRTVYSSCGLGFEETRYVEAHGTGTQLGDSSEARALGHVFKSSRSPGNPLYIGSVKANIGHLEGGSGLAGMLKSILILEKGIIPPNALFEKLNPKINARALNLAIPTSCIPWPSEGLRRISVNSFGFGGSNGHVILDDAYHCLQDLGLKGNHLTCMHPLARLTEAEDKLQENPGSSVDDKIALSPANHQLMNKSRLAPSEGLLNGQRSGWVAPGLPETNGGISSAKVSEPPSTPKLLVWSAKDEDAIKRTTQQYAQHLEMHSATDLDRLAYTLSERRSAMSWRSFAVSDINGSTRLPSKLPFIRSSAEVGLAFIFTGQGSQYANMGRRLVAYPVFSSALDRADTAFHDLGATWSLHDIIQEKEKINDPQLSQPLCTALQLALVELLRSFSIIPVAVLGHSSGEIAAAYTTGALSFESACKVAYHRGRLAGQLAADTTVTPRKPGAMMSVNLPELDVRPYLSKVFGSTAAESHVHVACVNSPTNVTLSGDEAAIDILWHHLDQDGIFARKLATGGVAYHSPTMRQIASEYHACLGPLQQEQDVGGHDNNIVMISSVTCEKVSKGQVVDSQYWVDNLVSPVRFSDALQYLEVAAPKADGLKPISVYLEVGPTGALQRPVRDTLSSISTGKNNQYLSTLSRHDSPLTSVLNVAGYLFARGYPVSITAANQQQEDRTESFLVELPEYPFDHSQTYWSESRLSRDWRLRGETTPRGVSDILGLRATDWNPLEPRWRARLSIRDIPWIGHHVVGDVAYFPGAAILMAALEAVRRTATVQTTHQTISGYLVKEIIFTSPIVVRLEDKTEVMTQLRRLQQAHDKASGVRYETRVFALVDGYWNECSKAVIHVEYAQDTPNEIDGSGYESRAALRKASAQAAYEDAMRRCTKPMSKEDFYKWHTAQRLKYGPSFALAQDTAWDGGEISVGRINTASAEPFDGGVAHPGVLDCAFQVASMASSHGLTRALQSAMILYRLKDFWISPKGWQYPDTSEVRVVSTSRPKTAVPGTDCSFMMLSDDGTPIGLVGKCEMLPAGTRQDSTDDGDGYHGGLLHSIAWKPQLSEMSQSQLRDHCRDFDAFLQLASHEIPCQRLLQIGRGSDVGSKLLMERALSVLGGIEDDSGGNAFTEYLYTDVSDELLQFIHEEPRAKISLRHSDRLQFAILDTDKDLTTQGLERGTYNMIFLSEPQNSSVHIREKVLASLRNLQRALRPGGYLVIDGVPATVQHGPERQEEAVVNGNGNIMTQSEWEELLKSAGFSGIDLAIPGVGDNRHMMIISRTAEESSNSSQTRQGSSLLLIDDQDDQQRTIAACLLQTARFQDAEVLNLSQLSVAAVESICITTTGQRKPLVLLADMDGSVLAHGSESHFGAIKKLLQSTTDILWVTMSESHRATTTPFSSIKDGFLRAMRAEYSGSRIVSLHIESNGADDVKASMDQVARYITQTFVSSFVTAKPEVEYLVRGGLFHTGRLATELDLDEKLQTVEVAAAMSANSGEDSKNTARSTKIVVSEPWLPGPALKVGVERPGSLETLQLIQDENHTADDELGPTEVEIEAKAWGLNFRDVFLALGRFEEDDFGIDCSGIVTRVGSQCDQDQVKPGDRVCMFAIGCMSMYPRADQGAVAIIPEGVGFAESCAVVSPVVTAWRALVDVARVQKGDKVLIHAASGATGQLAVQIAQQLGAEVFATVGYDFKKRLLIEEYGVPEDHIFYSRDTSFAEGILCVTNGYGVDVVLNSLVGEGLRASWDSMAPYGRFVEIGKTDIQSNSELPMARFAHNVSFSTVDMRHIHYHRPDIISGLMRDTMGLVARGILRAPTPIKTYKPSALEEAFRYFQSGKNVGRVVIDLEDCSCVVEKHVSPVHKSWSFDENASYMVAGGLGGIGCSILKWMAEKGAKYLIAPSRSGTEHKSQAAELVEELIQRGVTLSTPRCDVSVAEDLSLLLEESSKTMPRIKGCINAAMVLNDTIFDNMTHSQWERTIRSKVETSWNLHNLLPEDLDFFIFLSSISGIVGNPGQSNYSAGCTFQDALAQHRSRTGQRATSISLSVVEGIGVAAASEGGAKRKLTKGFNDSRRITESEIHAFLDLCCNPDGTAAQMPAHLTMGLPTPAGFVSQGMEIPDFMQRPLFSAHMSDPSNISGIGGKGNEVNYSAMFRQAESAEERAGIVFESLARKLARALAIKSEDIDANQPLHVFGVDSLVAMEIRNWIAKEFVADVAVFELMGGRSVAAICDLVTRMSQFQGTK